jgi:hypothetical protein
MSRNSFASLPMDQLANPATNQLPTLSGYLPLLQWLAGSPNSVLSGNRMVAAPASSEGTFLTESVFLNDLPGCTVAFSPAHVNSNGLSVQFSTIKVTA